MAFTDEDRNILIATATRVENIESKFEDLPCEQHPPECTQETRLKSLETTRSRGFKAVASTIIGLIMATVGYLFTKIGG